MNQVKIPNDRLDRLKHYFGYAIIFINLLLLLLFLIYTSKAYFQSDYATKMLLASEIIKHGTIIPPDWYYVNNDIWIFFIQLPLVLLEKIFGYGWASYAGNSIIYLGIYAWAVYYVAKQLKIAFLSKVLLFVLAFSALSVTNVDMFFGQLAGIMVPTYLFFFLGILLSLEKYESKKIFWLAGILVFVFAINNPNRIAVYYVGPSILITLLLYVDTKLKKYLILLGTILFSFILAWAIFRFLLIPNVLMNYSGAADLKFASYNEIINHISIFFSGLFDYANLVGDPSANVKSIRGAMHFLNFFFFLLMLIAIIKQIEPRTERIGFLNIISFFFLYYSIVIGYLYIFTNPLAQDSTTFRYFRPLFYLAMFFLVFYINRFRKWYRTLTLTVFLVLLTLSNYKMYINYASLDYLEHLENKHQRVADYLVDHNLTYGFAGYWDAAATMSLSENKVLVAPVNLGDFTPARWLNSDSWYHDYKAKRTFLLYNAGEYEYYNKIKKYFPRKPVQTISLDNFVILVYDYNIALPLNRLKTVIPKDLNSSRDGGEGKIEEEDR